MLSVEITASNFTVDPLIAPAVLVVPVVPNELVPEIVLLKGLEIDPNAGVENVPKVPVDPTVEVVVVRAGTENNDPVLKILDAAAVVVD